MRPYEKPARQFDQSRPTNSGRYENDEYTPVQHGPYTTPQYFRGPPPQRMPSPQRMYGSAQQQMYAPTPQRMQPSYMVGPHMAGPPSHRGRGSVIHGGMSRGGMARGSSAPGSFYAVPSYDQAPQSETYIRKRDVQQGMPFNGNQYIQAAYANKDDSIAIYAPAKPKYTKVFNGVKYENKRNIDDQKSILMQCSKCKNRWVALVRHGITDEEAKASVIDTLDVKCRSCPICLSIGGLLLAFNMKMPVDIIKYGQKSFVAKCENRHSVVFHTSSHKYAQSFIYGCPICDIAYRYNYNMKLEMLTNEIINPGSILGTSHDDTSKMRMLKESPVMRPCPNASFLNKSHPIRAHCNLCKNEFYITVAMAKDMLNANTLFDFCKCGHRWPSNMNAILNTKRVFEIISGGEQGDDIPIMSLYIHPMMMKLKKEWNNISADVPNLGTIPLITLIETTKKFKMETCPGDFVLVYDKNSSSDTAISNAIATMGFRESPRKVSNDQQDDPISEGSGTDSLSTPKMKKLTKQLSAEKIPGFESPDMNIPSKDEVETHVVARRVAPVEILNKNASQLAPKPKLYVDKHSGNAQFNFSYSTVCPDAYNNKLNIAIVHETSLEFKELEHRGNTYQMVMLALTHGINLFIVPKSCVSAKQIGKWLLIEMGMKGFLSCSTQDAIDTLNRIIDAQNSIGRRFYNIFTRDSRYEPQPNPYVEWENSPDDVPKVVENDKRIAKSLQRSLLEKNKRIVRQVVHTESDSPLSDSGTDDGEKSTGEDTVDEEK